MSRVTNSMLSNQLINNLNRQKTDMSRLQKQLATGKRVQLPEDDPVATATQMLYTSRLQQLDTFSQNISTGEERVKEIDSSLQSMTSIFQRFRVLMVQGANGIYTSFERKEAAATEVNQLLEELVSVANKRDATGRYLFAGYQTNTKPFEPIYHTVTAGRLGDAMVGVEYRGDIGELNTEVEVSEYIPTSIPGNRAFWATNQIIEANYNASGYSAPQNMQFKIDGYAIDVTAGDNLDIIIEKINQSPVEVKASRGGLNNIILSTTTPHQIWLEDIGSGNALQELGLIDSGSPQPPNNFSDTASISGYSIFELAIKIRDDLVRGDIVQIGGNDLSALDDALDNILKNLALVGARQRRFDELNLRVDNESMYMKELVAKVEQVDIAGTIMDLKYLETVNQYAMNVGSRIIRPTLLDFLR